MIDVTKPQCPKCRSQAITIHFECNARREYLRYRCLGCRFYWETPCADASAIDECSGCGKVLMRCTCIADRLAALEARNAEMLVALEEICADIEHSRRIAGSILPGVALTSVERIARAAIDKPKAC